MTVWQMQTVVLSTPCSMRELTTAQVGDSSDDIRRSVLRGKFSPKRGRDRRA